MGGIPLIHAVRILVSNEFYELYRGDKDFIIPRLIARRLGHDTAILSPDFVSPADAQAGIPFQRETFISRLGLGSEAVHFHHPRMLVRKTHNKRIPFLIPRLDYWRTLSAIRPDAILESIYTTLTPRSYLNGLYASRHRIPRLLLDAGDEGRIAKPFPLETRLIRSATKIFTYSPAGAARIQRKYGITDSSRFHIHFKLLDSDRFQFLPDQAPSTYTVGYVGRFLRAKGFDKFLELAAQNPVSGIHYKAVGANTDAFDLPPTLEHLPYADNDRMASVYSSIDLLLLPDMRQFLGYPTVVQEALMCGTPVATGCLRPDFYPRTDGVLFYDPANPAPLLDYLQHESTRTPADRLAARLALSETYRTAASPSAFLAALSSSLPPPEKFS